jgi:glutamate carboxypeptidase
MAPTEGNQQLLGVLDRINRDLGHGPMKPVPPADRGAADISFAAPHLPSLDGLGLLGKGDHSIEERVDLRSVPLATKRAALLIHRLSRHPR